MTKFHESVVINNLDNFRKYSELNILMRHCMDMFLFWKILKYLNPKTILEIGSSAGQTLGLMVEATENQSTYTSVDIDFSKMGYFESKFPLSNIQFIKSDSTKVELTKKFDFIHIDGDHSYEYVMNDIFKCASLSHIDTILVIDDFELPDVDKAIDNFLLYQNDFVPFMRGHQCMFFHHQSQELDYFLDYAMYENNALDIFKIENINYKNFTVLEGKLLTCFEKYHHIFVELMENYDF